MKFFDRLARVPGAKPGRAFSATIDGESLKIKVPGIAGFGTSLKWDELRNQLAEAEALTVTRPAPEGGLDVEDAPFPIKAKDESVKVSGAAFIEAVEETPAPEGNGRRNRARAAQAPAGANGN